MNFFNQPYSILRSVPVLSCLMAPLLGQADTGTTEGGSVLASIRPVHSLVASVAGEGIEIDLLLDRKSDSPHDTQMRPTQVARLNRADLVFYIDNDFEVFVARTLAKMPATTRRVALARHKKIDILPFREADDWGLSNYEAEDDHHGHDHAKHDDHDDHDDHAGHDDHDDHGDHDDHDDHGDHDDHDDHAGHDDHGHESDRASARGHHGHAHDHGFEDLHIWLGIENAKAMLVTIAAELSRRWPGRAELFEKNAKKTSKKLDQLNRQLKKKLKDADEKAFVVFHDAYQYFERSYGLNSLGALSFDTHQTPPPRLLRQVRERIEDRGVKCLFGEPYASENLIALLSEDTDIVYSEIDPLGGDIDPGADHYFLLMHQLADRFSSCLN